MLMCGHQPTCPQGRAVRTVFRILTISLAIASWAIPRKMESAAPNYEHQLRPLCTCSWLPNPSRCQWLIRIGEPEPPEMAGSEDHQCGLHASIKVFRCGHQQDSPAEQMGIDHEPQTAPKRVIRWVRRPTPCIRQVTNMTVLSKRKLPP